MKFRWSWILLAFFVAAVSMSLAETTTKSGFMQEVKAAIEARDSKRMIELTFFEGSPAKFVSDMETQLPELLNGLGKVTKVLYERGGDDAPFPQDGALWGPNLKVLGVIAIYKTDGSKTTLKYGKTPDGNYRLAGVKKVGELATSSAVLLDFVGLGRLVEVKINGKRLSVSGKSRGVADVIRELKKGENTMSATWKPEPGQRPSSDGYCKIIEEKNGKRIQTVRLDLTGPTGSDSVTFDL